MSCEVRCRRTWCSSPSTPRTDLVEGGRDRHPGTGRGSVLVAVVLLLFLGELRSALVVIVTPLPLAMLIAFIGMGSFGLSANLMSLAGLAIGIGMMVDGAVVMVENAFRIMAERRARRTRRSNGVLLMAAQGSRQPDRVYDSDHHRGVPAAVQLQGLEGKDVQADGVPASRSRWQVR